MNAVVALLAFGLAGRVGVGASPVVRAPARVQGQAQVADDSVAPLPVILPAAAVVGFAFLLMELVWYRMLSPC